VVIFITPVLVAAQEAVVAEMVAAVSAFGGLMVTVVVLVLPHTSVTRMVWLGPPATGVIVENILLDCGPAISVVLVASYMAYVYGPPPLPGGMGPPAVKFCGLVTIIWEK
jgi:hypothetical protein